MHVIPWRKQNGNVGFEGVFDDFWKNFSESFERTRERLPVAMQNMTAPPMNISETESTLMVTLELPGLDAKDINIELMGDQLQISGEKKWEEEKKGKEFHRVESQYGKFSRSLTLPQNLRRDRDAIEATFQKGILEIRIPKVEPTPASKIPIKAKS